MSGPVPKRSEERRRRNKSTTPTTRGLGAATIPAKFRKVDKDWHKLAKLWFESLKLSGQAQWYEPSDWAFAQYTADLMTRTLDDPATPGAVIKEVMRGMDSLLTTEGMRRRVRMELERPSEVVPASVSLMDDYRKAAAPTNANE